MGSIKDFARTLSKETKWHGNHDENGKQLALKAGKLSMVFENGNLRYISMGNYEVLRMIYSAVRDRSWITVKPVFSDKVIEILPDSFTIKFTALYKSPEIAFQAHYSITGNQDNSLIISFEGEALNDFEKNRIGFCVLHPIESNKGKKCIIVHINGSSEEMTFPFDISPHQPFLDIKSMSWGSPGMSCSLDFFGDVFETEDQRNWTDASYKTYCTPLRHPKPAKILRGQKISQKIILGVNADNHTDRINEQQITITVDRKNALPFPMIGIGRSTRLNSFTKEEAEVLKKLEFDHYRIDLFMFNIDWESIADTALSEAAMLGYKMEMALFFDDDYINQIEIFIEFINRKKIHPVIVILYHKNIAVIPDLMSDKIAENLKKAIPDIKVCCGTNANFVQLNRNRPHPLYADYICYSIHPQEHASDNLTLVENLKAQEYTVESAKQFSDNRKIWISTVNIQRRFNSNVSNYELSSENASFPPQADSRLMSLFGGCWITGSLKYLVEGGAAGITLLETVGERGIIQGDFNSRWPEDFQAIKGMIFPVFFVLKYILKYKKSGVLKSISSDPLKVESLVISEENKLRIILVNFTDCVQTVRIDDNSEVCRVRILNSETYCSAIGDDAWLDTTEEKELPDGKIKLEPFSIIFAEA